VRAVAGGIDVAGAFDQHHRLDVGANGIVDRGVDDVITLVRVLDHEVAGAVDEIDVVAGTPDHGVGAAPAIEHAVVRASYQRVVPRLPDEAANGTVHAGAGGAGVVGGFDQHHRFDIGGEGIVDRGVDDVVTLVRVLDHDIAGAVDEIDVVASAPRQG